VELSAKAHARANHTTPSAFRLIDLNVGQHYAARLPYTRGVQRAAPRSIKSSYSFAFLATASGCGGGEDILRKTRQGLNK